VTKKEIVKTISDEIGLTQLKTKEIVQKTFDAIVRALVEEKRIELRNFGVFEVKQRAARKARNPRTGQRVDVPQKFVVTFKPGSATGAGGGSGRRASQGRPGAVATGDGFCCRNACRSVDNTNKYGYTPGNGKQFGRERVKGRRVREPFVTQDRIGLDEPNGLSLYP